MSLLELFDTWLIHSAVFSTILLSLGVLIIGISREPLYRMRIIQWTFIASLLVPLFQQWELMPGYSLGVWQMARNDQTLMNLPSQDITPVQPISQKPNSVISAAKTILPYHESTTQKKVEMPFESKAQEEIYPTSINDSVPFTAIEFLRLIYLALVAWMLLKWIVALVRRNAIASHAQPADMRVRNILVSVADPRARSARLLVSDRIDSLMMWGIFRPTIVISKRLVAAEDLTQLRWGLAHEWSHVVQRDYHNLLIAGLAKLVCFYQPGYWWLRRHLLLSQDFLADAYAAKQGESAEAYASFLVTLSRNRNQPLLAGTLGIGVRSSKLFSRIKMLVQSTRPPLERARRLPSMAIVLVALLTISGLSVLRLSAAPNDKQVAEFESANELPDSITYRGKVVDRDTGEPIAGATVEVTHELSRDPKTNEWVTLHTTKHKSNEKGEYRFTLPPEEVAESSLYLVVDAHHSEYQSKGRSGYSHSMIRKNIEMGEPPFFTTIKLSAGEAITGTVLQPDGTPAVNAQITVYSKTPTKEPGINFGLGAFQFSKTDESGHFRVVIATPGDGVLWVFPKEASPTARRIGDQRGDLGTLQLLEGTRLSGQVLDVEGNPVDNVAVNLRRKGDGKEADEFLNKNAVANGIASGTKTDEQGRFQLNPLPQGTYYARVDEHVHDPSLHKTKRGEELKVDHVFEPLEVEIIEGEANEPLLIRAVPHVLVRGRFFDGSGEPRSSHKQHLFARMNDKHIFKISTRPGDDGWFEFKLPQGVEKVQIDLSTNEHSSLRWRLKPGEPLTYGGRIELGTLEEDFTTLEVIRYEAPLLLLKAVDEEGMELHDFTPSSKYTIRPAYERRGTYISGALGDIGFESQPDGRWRSSQLLPDEEVTVTLKKDGYTCEPRVVSLEEGEERELVFVLKPT